MALFKHPSSLRYTSASLLPQRLVFDNLPAGGLEMASEPDFSEGIDAALQRQAAREFASKMAQAEASHERGVLAKAHERDRADTERLSVQKDTSYRAVEIAEQIEDNEKVDESGAPKEYVETLKSSPKFERVVVILRNGIEHAGEESIFNYKLWPARIPPEKVAAVFEGQGDPALGELFYFMPKGKGRLRFIAGLTAEPNSSEFKESHEALRALVETIDKRMEKENSARASLEKEQNEPMLGYTAKEMKDTFMNNWRNAKGVEKLALGGAVVASLYILWSWKDETIPGTDWKLSSIGKMAGVAYLLNLLSGKLAPDGKTLLNRVDLGPDLGVDELEDDMIKGYALDQGMDDDKTKLHTFQAAAQLDVRSLFSSYKRTFSSPSHVKKEISGRELGLPESKINGEDMYEIMDDLVRTTGANLAIQQMMEEKGVTHPSKLDQGELKNRIAYATQDDQAIAAFQQKYLYGSLAGTEQSLLRAVVNEYGDDDFRAVRGKKSLSATVSTYEKSKLTTRGIETVKGAARSTKEWVTDDAYPWVVGAGASVYGFTRDKVAGPIANFASRKYNEYAPVVSGAIREKRSYFQERDLNQVLPPDMLAAVPTYGKATVLGYPNISIETKEDANGNDLVIIDGITFERAKGPDGTTAERQQLEAKIKARVVTAIATNPAAAALIGSRSPQWSVGEKAWIVSGIPMGGNPAMGLASQPHDLRITIDANEKPHFFSNSKEVIDFSKLDLVHTHSEVERRIWDDPAYSVLKGLEVKVTGIAGTPAVIEGTIAGLKFKAVPRAASLINGVAFYDGTAVGGLEKLALTQANGGDEFLATKTAAILNDGTFLNPFLQLEALMDTTDESFLMTPDTLPSGPIKEKKWQYILDYKKIEALDNFKLALSQPGKTLADVQPAYDATVKLAVDQVEKLYTEVQRLSDKERGEKFGELMGTLETVNYTNPDYIKLFGEYKHMIEKFDLPGAGESWENLMSSHPERYEIYQVLLAVWSTQTRAFAINDVDRANATPANSLSTASQTYLRTVVMEPIRKKLELAAQRDGGTLKLENLPAYKTEEERLAWIDQSTRQYARSPWSRP
ncbi:hypothetical protein CO046_00725 [Candidatus Peregrinibacteria bacterium CG_4_9_14_0_2_um_filter_53_11]|nr:MAG: hypothetical protein CO046_00725 [Candidatus Peregrinibacteria bacterium CG_4_9_14_0_2_um_filter_53_11]